MPGVARGQTFGPSTLLLCTADSAGQMYDPDGAGPSWRIVRVADETKVLPTATATQSEAGRHVYTGVFVPKAANGSALAVPSTLGIERHRIEWTWTHGGVDHQLAQEFDVLDAGVGLSFYGYISLADLREAGITPQMLTDRAARDGIQRAQQLVDDYCRQPFAPTRRDMRFDGTNSRTLMLAEALIGVEAVYLNESGTALEKTEWRANTVAGGGRRARGNPYVELVEGWNRSIFMAPALTGQERTFLRGQLNQRLVGMFGSVDADQLPPVAVRQACLELVALKAGQRLRLGRVERAAGDIVSETTDGHSVTYESRGAFVPGVIPDRQILAALNAYRAPMAVGVAAEAY